MFPIIHEKSTKIRNRNYLHRERKRIKNEAYQEESKITLKTSTGLRFIGGYTREIEGAGERSERINQRAYVLSDRFKREDEAAKI